MVGGILFQLTPIIAYAIFMSIVFSRDLGRLKFNRALMRLAAAIVVVVCCMFARGVDRGIELLQEWNDYLNTHGEYVIALDGSLMVLVVLGLNIYNPGMLLGVPRKERGLKEESDGEEAKMSPSNDSSVV
jgi:hypothetical protein